MPARPLYPCTQPGCAELIPAPGRCTAHAKKPTGWTKPTTAKDPKRYGYQWRKLREVVMRRDAGLCQVCKAAGVTKLAAEVDHIQPVEQGGSDDLDNLQSICRECHKMKTAFESADGRVQAMPEWLPKPRIPVTVVCGAPASGKSTYVGKHASPRDLVIDVDVIASQLTGKPLHDSTFNERLQAARVRNKLLASLAGPCDYRRCWLIITASSEYKRHWWRDKLGADLVVLEPDKRTCLQRLADDPHRCAAAKQRARQAILDWC